MTRTRVGAIALALLFPLTAFAGRGGFSQTQDFRSATTEELALKGVEGDAGGEAAILDWIVVDDDQNSISASYFRVKVFTEEGKKHADVEIPYIPGYPLYMAITDLQARTIRPDVTIVPFDGKIYDKVLLKAGRRAVRAKTFTLSDVQPGSILEYRYIRRWTERYLLNTHWSVQREIPVVHAKFTLKPFDTKGEYGSFFTYYGLDAPPAKIPGGYELELANMPALRPEPFMPPEEELRARVNFFYTDSRVRLEKFWEVQSGVFTEQIEKFIGRSGTAATVAKQLESTSPDRKTLLEKIYRYAMSLRNLSFLTDKTDQELDRENVGEAKNVEDVLKKNSGFAHEINRVFVAMARAAGFDASAVRVAPRDDSFFSDKIPDAEQMNGEIALVNVDGNVDGKPLYLDPGTPTAPFGILSWEKSNVPGIQIVKGTKSPIATVPLQEPGDAVLRRKAELKLNDDVLEGTITVSFTGQEALVRRLPMLHDDEAAQKKAIEDEVKGWFPDGATLKLTSISGHDTGDAAITATFEASLPNVVATAGSKTVVPISIFETKAKNPFAASKRKHPVYFPYPQSEEDEIRLTIPVGLAVATLPNPTDLSGETVKYKSSATSEGGTITFRRSTSINAVLVDVPYYPALRKFFNARTTADQQPLVLVAQ